MSNLGVGVTWDDPELQLSPQLHLKMDHSSFTAQPGNLFLFFNLLNKIIKVIFFMPKTDSTHMPHEAL